MTQIVEAEVLPGKHLNPYIIVISRRPQVKVDEQKTNDFIAHQHIPAQQQFLPNLFIIWSRNDQIWSSRPIALLSPKFGTTRLYEKPVSEVRVNIIMVQVL